MFKQLTFLLIVILALTACLPVSTQIVPATQPAPSPIPTTPDSTPPTTPDATPAGYALASINGWVWHDECAVGGEGGSPANLNAGCIEDAGRVHADGLKAGNELPIGGVKVLLGMGAYPSIGLAETTTLATDLPYSFTGLSAGTYCVSIDPTQEQNVPLLLPGNWTYPTLTYGVVGATVVLKAGENKFDVNFGWDYQFLPAPSANTGGHGGGSCTYQATFVTDVTVPDNTVYAPGT